MLMSASAGPRQAPPWQAMVCHATGLACPGPDSGSNAPSWKVALPTATRSVGEVGPGQIDLVEEWSPVVVTQLGMNVSQSGNSSASGRRVATAAKSTSLARSRKSLRAADHSASRPSISPGAC